MATIDEQVRLELEHVRRKADDLERYIGLAALQDRNETLFYRLLVENLEEFLPIVYTPTVGLACQQFSHIFRRPRGVWITPDDVGRIDDILRSAGDDIRLIVVTDNERILGLGDQGAGGMAIPVGKLALYTAAAGIYPARTLPVSLDVGTDRRELLDDPLYVGYRAPRLRGTALRRGRRGVRRGRCRVFPAAVIQWEDFKQHNAVRVLDRYRHRQPSFNDDIQGTGAVVLAGLLAARRERGGLTSDRFMFLGAGGAAIGIATLLQRELVAEGMDPGRPPRRSSCSTRMAWFTPIVRLCRRSAAVRRHTGRDSWRPGSGRRSSPILSPSRAPPGRRSSSARRPAAGAFTEALVREVALHDRVPIVLPLSNPGACAEASPEDILAWTDGRALVAAGGPSRDVVGPGGTRVIGQANNVFVFPGVGLGAIVAETREITDEMFLVAAHELAGLVSADRLRTGALYPPIAGLRAVARAIAVAVAREARDGGHGRDRSDLEIEAAVDRRDVVA